MNPGNFNGLHVPLPLPYLPEMNTVGFYSRLPVNMRQKLECVECEKVYPNEAALREHYATHFPPTTPSATPAGRSTNNRQTTSIDTSRGKIKAHNCEICGKGFRQKAVLKTHMKIHSDVKDHHCPECGRGFTYKANMDVHMRVHSGEKPHKCCHCGKAFSQANTLKFHLSIHTGYKPYVCPTCQKAFITKGNLQDHMISHTKEKPFKCEICGDGFARKVSLRVHERLHTGEKPYQCKYCETSYAAYSSLKYHQKKHCGPNSRDYLNRHNNSGTSSSVDDVDFDFLLDSDVLDSDGNKQDVLMKGGPVYCPVCGKSFRYRMTYLKHCQSCVANGNSYPCAHCSAVFNDQAALEQHNHQHRLDTIASARLQASNLKHELMEPSETTEHPCGICGEQFSSELDLQNHIPSHRFKVMNNQPSAIQSYS